MRHLGRQCGLGRRTVQIPGEIRSERSDPHRSTVAPRSHARRRGRPPRRPKAVRRESHAAQRLCRHCSPGRARNGRRRLPPARHGRSGRSRGSAHTPSRPSPCRRSIPTAPPAVGRREDQVANGPARRIEHPAHHRRTSPRDCHERHRKPVAYRQPCCQTRTNHATWGSPRGEAAWVAAMRAHIWHRRYPPSSVMQALGTPDSQARLTPHFALIEAHRPGDPITLPFPAPAPAPPTAPASAPAPRANSPTGEPPSPYRSCAGDRAGRMSTGVLPVTESARPVVDSTSSKVSTAPRRSG